VIREKQAKALLSDSPIADSKQLKKQWYNKGLRLKLEGTCVLFVQHRSKNGRTHTLPRGSFIACAESFGNCDAATEGGIPRSSRFRWFA
jgi:hypothetical protein